MASAMWSGGANGGRAVPACLRATAASWFRAILARCSGVSSLLAGAAAPVATVVCAATAAAGWSAAAPSLAARLRAAPGLIVAADAALAVAAEGSPMVWGPVEAVGLREPPLEAGVPAEGRCGLSGLRNLPLTSHTPISGCFAWPSGGSGGGRNSECRLVRAEAASAAAAA